MNDTFIFSVLIPITDTEEHFSVSVDTVINQNIDFNKSIQLILIFFGNNSFVNPKAEEYKKRYPNNIECIHVNTNSVALAKNLGIKKAKGKYINILECGYKWNKGVFLAAYQDLKKRKLDMVVVQQQGGERNNIIIDITKADSPLQHNLSEYIFERNVVADTLFNEKLVGYEDCKYLLDISIKLYGEVIPYIQHIVMKKLQQGIGSSVEDTKKHLSQEQLVEYEKLIVELVKEIDDSIILEQKDINYYYKLFCLSLKYGCSIDELKEKFILSESNEQFLFNGNKLLNTNSKGICQIRHIDVNDSKVEINGIINDCLPKGINTFFIVNKKEKIKIEPTKKIVSRIVAFNGTIIKKGYYFETVLDLQNLDTLSIAIEIESGKYVEQILNLHSDTKISPSNIPAKYKIENKKIIISNRKSIRLFDYSLWNHFKKETKYCTALFRKRKINIFAYRLLVSFCRLFCKKPIWIISDRPTRANDNGTELFKYLSKEDINAKIYFVIDRESEDYNIVRQVGKVLPINTIKYKVIFLLTDIVISSQADEWVTNAFGKEKTYINDLYKFKFVFLQHGITQNDISDWLHKTKKNISLFLTTSNAERQSIVGENYGYTEQNVKVTGFPRFDTLENKEERLVLVMPTWRKAIAGEVNQLKGTREYSKTFVDSEYFCYYNNFINDEQILEVMDEEGYKGIFVCHPSHSAQAKDFERNDIFTVYNGIANYTELFAKGSILVTDYSSVHFDFAYLNKPVIYSQFDRDAFFGRQWDEGYFSYEKNGFGQVTSNYDDTVNELIKQIRNKCTMEQKYIERVECFFKYHDKNNSQRVTQEILKLHK